MTPETREFPTFDLHELNVRYHHYRFGERVAGLATFVSLGTILIGVLAFRWQSVVQSVPKLSPLGIVWLIEVAIGVSMISLGVSLFIIARPNLSSLQLGSDGLVLGLRGGKYRIWKWNDPKLHFRLQNIDGQLPARSNPVSTRFLSIPRGPTSALTVEAYDALLDSARLHGVTIETYRGVKGVGLVPIIYDIHGTSVHVWMWFRSPVGS